MEAIFKTALEVFLSGDVYKFMTLLFMGSTLYLYRKNDKLQEKRFAEMQAAKEEIVELSQKVNEIIMLTRNG